MLEEDLLQTACRISVSRRSLGLARARKAEEIPYEAGKKASLCLSTIIRSKDWSLEEATRFFCDENRVDSRPSKWLDSKRLQLGLRGYPHLNHLTRISEFSIDVKWIPGPNVTMWITILRDGETRKWENVLIG
ncbi:hypothetical protein PHMEG_00036789 [Phytophthora megakarya]|uniref:Uncharacterized protein n=1 Tax=Phytophthora megakarya TaxID=4795 RepID=A0A225UL22_9STRA|nr:hypothetical protein PHMEG_00036789 [Phytophthora megakarya]